MNDPYNVSPVWVIPWSALYYASMGTDYMNDCISDSIKGFSLYEIYYINYINDYMYGSPPC